MTVAPPDIINGQSGGQGAHGEAAAKLGVPEITSAITDRQASKIDQWRSFIFLLGEDMTEPTGTFNRAGETVQRLTRSAEMVATNEVGSLVALTEGRQATFKQRRWRQTVRLFKQMDGRPGDRSCCSYPANTGA